MHNQTDVHRRRAGRKMQRGRLVVDQAKGRMGIFVDYCPDPKCDAKIILDKEDLNDLMRWIKRDEKSRARRILEFFLQSRLI